MYSAPIGGLLPCAACCVVGLRWLADVSCTCVPVPLLVSCSGFGLPMHAQLLRLFCNTTARAPKDTADEEPKSVALVNVILPTDRFMFPIAHSRSLQVSRDVSASIRPGIPHIR